MEHGETKTVQEEQPDETQLVTLLAMGATIRRAARLCGMSVTTVWRRRQSQEFRELIRAARRDLIDQTTGRLSKHSVYASDRLRKLAASENETVAGSATRAILEQAQNYYRLNHLEDEVTEIRAFLESKFGDLGLAQGGAK